MLDSLTNCDGPDGQLYCKNCYAVKFGPQMEHKIIGNLFIKNTNAVGSLIIVLTLFRNRRFMLDEMT